MTDLSVVAGMTERLVSSSPAIVGMMSVIGLVVWRTWRDERTEHAAERREERLANSERHKELLAVVEKISASSDRAQEKTAEALMAMRDAVTDLRVAIREKA